MVRKLNAALDAWEKDVDSSRTKPEHRLALIDVAPADSPSTFPRPGTFMSPLLAEFFGTAILIVLGDGVVANVVLHRTKGNASGWIVIVAGWAFGVTIAVYCVNSISGAHLNPAVSIALAAIGAFPWRKCRCTSSRKSRRIPGRVIVWLTYLPHWKETLDPTTKLAVFSTTPRSGTTAPTSSRSSSADSSWCWRCSLCCREQLRAGSDLAKGFGPMLVGVIVAAIGLSLGGPTGYAINPARDLGRALRTPYFRSLARVAPTGATRGFPSSVRSWAACSARCVSAHVEVMKYILALDQERRARARSSSITLARSSASHRRSFVRFSRSRLGGARPRDIWSTRRASRRGAPQGKRAAADIAAIGITNQRETTSSGIAPRENRSATRSCGRTDAPPASAIVCGHGGWTA